MYGFRIERSAYEPEIERSARAISIRSRQSARAEASRYREAQAAIDEQAGPPRPARPSRGPRARGFALLLRRS
jgi:hypothetical protein